MSRQDAPIPRWARIAAFRPAPLLVALLVAWGVAGACVPLAGMPLAGWLGAGAALALVAALDAWRLARRPTPRVARQVPETLALGLARTVGLRVDALGRAAQRLDVYDLHPGAWPAQGLPRRFTLAPASSAHLDYTVQPVERGDAVFAGTQLRLHAPWRLWRQRRQAGAAQAVRVFPDFAPLARLALFSAEQASRLVGAHLRRRRGEGTDFNQMREYRVGDSLRQIDWKATSRAGKLISREYQDEKNQQLVLLLDTGRRMMAREAGLSHFDHALNAALVVSYLALRQGDAVGLLASGGQSRWVPPRRGLGNIDSLLRAAYDLQPQPVATDYLAAASDLAARQRRRTLVMLVTNVRDEDIEDLLGAVRLLRKRHLVCVASLREAALDRVLQEEVHDVAGAAMAGATARYLTQRAAAHDALRSHHVMVLDVTSEQLPGALVERYLAVKRDGLL